MLAQFTLAHGNPHLFISFKLLTEFLSQMPSTYHVKLDDASFPMMLVTHCCDKTVSKKINWVYNKFLNAFCSFASIHSHFSLCNSSQIHHMMNHISQYAQERRLIWIQVQFSEKQIPANLCIFFSNQSKPKRLGSGLITKFLKIICLIYLVLNVLMDIFAGIFYMNMTSDM